MYLSVVITKNIYDCERIILLLEISNKYVIPKL